VLDVNELIAEELKMLRRLVGEDVAIEAKLAPDVGAVLADTGGLQQVLMNLVVNARDAMPDGGRITIESANVEGDAAVDPALPQGRCVRIAVRDTGIGMSPEVQAHLFEPFFTTKGEGRGTGLGLATTFGIIKQAGGHVVVESAPGEGACFCVYLPRHSGAPAHARRPAPSPAAHGCGRSVLVVEDDPGVLRVAARALEQAGYRVEATQDPREALRIAAAQCDPSLDVLLTDVVMPGLGGAELAERIRGLCPTTKVVLMSGYAERHAEGFPRDTLLLVKPFDRRTLLATIAEALDGPSSP
jgi:CheY-like chemotaxis protein